MKKQNGINKLAFNKAAVVELNFNEMNNVNGGTSPAISIAVASSEVCVVTIGIGVGYALNWLVDQ